MGNLIGVHSVNTMYSIKKTFELDKYPERYEVIIEKCLEAERQNKVNKIHSYLRKKMEIGLLLQEKRRIENAKKEKEQSK